MHSNPFEAIRRAQMSAQRIFCHTITAADNSGDGGVLADGFFIALVTNGTAEVSASDACRFEAGPRDLLLGSRRACARRSKARTTTSQ